MRRHARPDANQGEIVQALLKVGASVLDLHAAGIKGAPDLLAGYHGQDVLIEIKTQEGRLEPEQCAWHDAWRGHQVAVVRTVDEALQAIGAL